LGDHNEKIVEHLFRTEYGKLVAILTRLFGTAHIQLAEDVVQDTLISALESWSLEGTPTNPTGWLVQVAKRKALNVLKREKMTQGHQVDVLSQTQNENFDTFFLDNEIKDSQLRMIFTCCHTSLPFESQIALTLKTLCGFGVNEVASALLTTTSTINKRLYRAKTTIRESDDPFDIPQGAELDTRLEAVSLTLYLIFNEGYNSSSSNSLIRKELCLEAIRLTKLLVDQFEKNQKLCALLALMCFHTARFDARIDDHGAIVLFEDQERTLWNKELINIGMQYLQKSTNTTALSTYHIEARIAAEHCLSKSFESTNWQTIFDQYELLEKLKPNPIIKLNLAIIQSKLQGLEASLTMLDELVRSKILKHYHLLPATQGVFYIKLKNYSLAIEYLEKAISLKPSLMEQTYIENQIVIAQKKLTKN
jgi:RNA polymerase sigma-70 factor (ECF subfamily)